MLYGTFRGIFRLIFKILFRLKVTGAENFPSSGPVIISSNHISWWDPPLIAVISPRKTAFMAKEELFKIPVFRVLIKRLGAFPVKRASADRRALKTALNILKKGEQVALFPEGTRSKTGKIQKPLPGVGFIARKSSAAVVPVAIKGPYKLFRPLEVQVGRPLNIKFSQEDAKGKSAFKISEIIVFEIAKMLGQKYDLKD